MGVICFLCKGHVPYTRNNMGKFERHMKSDHSVFFGVDYLLAGCLMSEDERLAVTDVVEEKEISNEKETEVANGTSRATRIRGRSAQVTLEEGEVNNHYDFASENNANEEVTGEDVDPLANVSISSVVGTKPVNVKLERSIQRPNEHSGKSKKSKKLQKRLQKNVKMEKDSLAQIVKMFTKQKPCKSSIIQMFMCRVTSLARVDVEKYLHQKIR